MPKSYNGWSLKFYANERELFPKEFAFMLDNSFAKKLAGKISRHFKFHVGTIKFTAHHVSHAYDDGDLVFPKKGCSLGELCHELAHLCRYQNQHDRNWRHNKKLFTTMKRIIQFANKKVEEA